MLSEMVHVVGECGGVTIAGLCWRVKCAMLSGKAEGSMRRGNVDMLRCVDKSIVLRNGDGSLSGMYGGRSIATCVVVRPTLLFSVGMSTFKC